MRMDAHASLDKTVAPSWHGRLARALGRRNVSAGRPCRLAHLSLLLLIVLSASSGVSGQPVSQDSSDSPTRIDVPTPATDSPVVLPGLPNVSSFDLPDLTKPANLSSAMQIIILLTVLSLAPAILLMMTCFTRIIIVLSLLRQALGTQQLPPNQILIGLSMFMTFLVMAPTWQRMNDEAVRPYLDGQMSQTVAIEQVQIPIREFMIKQIEAGGNEEDVFLFAEFGKSDDTPPPERWEQVHTITLVPAFMLSELKTAFLLGFNVYLPFLVIDMVISIVLISMGMMMLPPALISLPFKLLLFVLVDGWRLITLSLMGSFQM